VITGSTRAIRRNMCRNQGIPWPGTGKDQRGRKNGGPVHNYPTPKRKALSILDLFKTPHYAPVTDRRKRRAAKRLREGL
jgi:hypothetical protein